MLRDPLAWLLYSPRRLLTGAVVAAVCAAGVVLALDKNDPATMSARATTVAPSTPSSKARAVKLSDSTEDPGDPAAIQRTAREFLRGYLVAPGASAPKSVPTSLRRVTTPNLWQGLQLTRPDMLPRGSLENVRVDSLGPFSGTVTANLGSGRSLSVSVVAWQKGWRVSDVRPTDLP